MAQGWRLDGIIYPGGDRRLMLLTSIIMIALLCLVYLFTLEAASSQSSRVFQRRPYNPYEQQMKAMLKFEREVEELAALVRDKIAANRDGNSHLAAGRPRSRGPPIEEHTSPRRQPIRSTASTIERAGDQDSGQIRWLRGNM